jgi:hypothetical protein
MSLASHLPGPSGGGPVPSTGGPAPSPAPATARPASLAELAALAPASLDALYARAATPVLADMDGPLVGRMLAVTMLPGWLAGLLRRFAAWGGFPWRGKTFAARGAGRGEGINRVLGDRKSRKWFRFETFVGPSRAGSFDAVQLDYDNPDNPGFIRAIKDEVREVAPGLYLGLAYFAGRGRARLVLYFGLHKR